jgi:glycosyltransferase involved in cell wall biosynthesis
MRRPLRICMVHYSDFLLDSRIQRQARALAERGDTVELVCLGEAQELPVGDGLIRIHPVPVPKPVGGPRAYAVGYARFFAHALRRVTAMTLRGGLDLVEVHNMPDALTFTAIAPKLRGTPVVLNCHDTFPELFATKFERPAEDRWTRLIYREERLSAAIADHVITVTEEARRRLLSRGIGTRGGSVVMNSPDPGIFGSPRPAAAPPADGPVRVLYHGGLAPRFGVETLIRAVAGADRPGLARIQLRVCGSGEDRARLAALAAELAPGRIAVDREPVPFEEIPAALEAADIGVVPTLHDDFTELLLPVKLLEYVHMGLPAVTSRLPAIQGYFAEDEVWFFEPGSPEALADAVLQVCADPAEARARATRAARRLASIAWDEQRSRYLELVDDLAGGRDRRTRRKSGGASRVAPTTAS